MMDSRRNSTECTLCENQAQHPQSGLCHACYSSLYYWSKKTPTQIAKRARQVEKFERRMRFLATQR